MAEIKTATAIRNFFKVPGYNPDMVYPPLTMTEIKDLKTACTDDEWQELGIQAHNALN